MKAFRFLFVAVIASTMLGACSYVPTSEQIQDHQQEILNREAVREVGMPRILNFWEKRQLKMIYELRDKAPNTYTYIVDMNGHFHKVCDSIGYGIPASMQYTNPERVTNPGTSYNAVIPQADPNGLYSPSSAEGTFVICLDPKTHHNTVFYAEPRIVVSPFELPTT